MIGSVVLQVLAHTKAAGAEEVLRRIEKELRLKLQEKENENHSLTQKVKLPQERLLYS